MATVVAPVVAVAAGVVATAELYAAETLARMVAKPEVIIHLTRFLNIQQEI